MKQKEIYLADLNPTLGSEQKGIRPVVIISGDTMNDNFNICIACLISSKIKNYTGCLILKKDNINNLEQDSEVLTFQIKALANERLKQKIGEITNEQLISIIKYLNEILIY
jgi:mRNA interferase MazF